ncbi:MAG: threonine/serine dehydratase [Proteobacteria bacterium]|nr:threonine/serine dehydratase [Pseudomonadota bacterium]
MSGPAPIEMQDIAAAARRLAGQVRRTPVLELAASELGTSQPVALKLEFLQHTGSFKARGALNRIALATLPPAGVIAASGGNHGAAVAWAAQRRGVRAEIFVPEPTPAAKLLRINGYGATVVRGGAAYAEAFAACQARQAETGALMVHAYDQAEVLAGQGTVGLEFEHDAPDLTHVLVAVGGGGLIGGIAGWYAGRAAVIGVEPHSCPTLNAALAAGRPVPVEVGGIAADSLGARQVGGLMFATAQRYGLGAVTAPDTAIRDAQRWLWDRLRIVAEPGGATAFAALLCGAFVPPEGARVGVVLCGANTNLASSGIEP